MIPLPGILASPFAAAGGGTGGLSARPAGALVWCHTPDPGRVAAIARLAREFEAENDQIRLIVSAGGAANPAQPPLPANAAMVAAPSDQPRALRGFLDHWRPDALVWFGADIVDRIVSETALSGTVTILADAGADALKPQGGLWRSRQPKARLGQFDHILCTDAATELRLRKILPSGIDIRATGALDESHPVLRCIERDRADLAATLATRPIWLAADPDPDERGALVDAHRIASHRAHRLLLVIATDDTAATVAHFNRAGFAVADRSAGQEPTDATEVLVSDTTELGLFYRLAPICFLGGSLAAQARRDPFEAASLGSALLHGPVTSPYAASLARLDSAGAARAVRSGEDLGATLERLQSPDRAAQLAHAAWEVVSQGAEATNHLIAILRAATDRSGPPAPPPQTDPVSGPSGPKAR